MKQKKEPIVKDERTMLLDGKIAGELVLGMTCFIALSAFVKSSILDLDLVAYLPEMFLLIAMGAYAFVRRISSGIDIRDMLEKDILCCACDSYGCDWKERSNELYLESKVSGQNSIRNSRLCHPDRSA